MFAKPYEINKFWWLWIPALFMVIQIILEMSLDPAVLSQLHSENGPHELLQFAAISSAFVIALWTLFQMDKKKWPKWLRVWLFVACAGCFYVAGEEISWGQHFMDWTTPEFWAAVNDQKEINFHNTSSWLDQKPRILLEIGVLTGGLIIPLLRKYKQGFLPDQFAVIYPPAVLAVIAGTLVVLKILDEVSGAMHIILFERISEVEEVYLYYFIFLYLLVLKRRIRGAAYS